MSSAIWTMRNGVLRHWILVSAAVVVLAVASGAILLALNWPFTQTAVTQALEDRFARDVKIRKFRSTYFPPGCVAEGIEFLHRERKDLPPLITVQTLTIRTSYGGLLRIHKLVDDVQVSGLHVLVPPKDPHGSRHIFPLTNSTSGKTLTIGEITADGAVLEFISEQPIRRPVHPRNRSIDSGSRGGERSRHVPRPVQEHRATRGDPLRWTVWFLERRGSRQHRTFGFIHL